MLFGTDNQILQVCPAHRTDLILRKVNVDRYDDRDLVRTNLIDSYDRILAFIKKHLPDPFYLEGIERRSLRDAIFREVASNILIHREYASGVPARLIIEYGKVTTYNANRPHRFGVLNPETSTPFPKNPIIGAFFREIDRADELGSGMRKMMLYGKKYGGAEPELIEGDVFRMIIKVPEFGGKAELSEETGQVGEQVGEQVKSTLESLKEGAKSKQDLLTAMGLSNAYLNYKRHIVPMMEQGLIEMTIPEKPQSRMQKYIVTAKGKDLLEKYT